MKPPSPPPGCRFCGTALGELFVDLGSTPLANSYLDRGAIAAERQYPLQVYVCPACLLVQVGNAVPPETIFSDYHYLSSTSAGWVRHAADYAAAMIDRFGLGPGSRVVEIASNDGYLLQHFVRAGISALGVEPAANVAAIARDNGVPTESMFFSRDSAARLRSQGRDADLMVANNVLAHVPAIADLVGGFAVLLRPEGVATFEFPHVLNLIRAVQFDTIYHEHYSYLSLCATERIFAAAGLRVFDVEDLPTHGGSLRLFVCHAGAGHAETPRVGAVRELESAAGLDTLAGYRGFGEAVATIRDEFRAFVARARTEARTIAAYGAAAKGNTFLTVCGITSADIVEVYDNNPMKQGKFLPGSHIPVVDPRHLFTTRPDYLVILPWNLEAEIRRSIAAGGDWRGQVIVADPHVRIL